MTRIEQLLDATIANGDLRRKEAIELQRELSTLCDKIGEAAEKAGLSGLKVKLEAANELDSVGQAEMYYYARICKNRVMLCVDDVEYHPQTGKPYTEWRRRAIWTRDDITQYDVPLASRHHSVLLASKLQELVEALHNRSLQLVEETREARKQVAAVSEQI